MTILFALSVVSLCALLWAAFAIARHIRRAAPLAAQPPDAEPVATVTTSESTGP